MTSWMPSFKIEQREDTFELFEWLPEISIWRLRDCYWTHEQAEAGMQKRINGRPALYDEDGKRIKE